MLTFLNDKTSQFSTFTVLTSVIYWTQMYVSYRITICLHTNRQSSSDPLGLLVNTKPKSEYRFQAAAIFSSCKYSIPYIATQNPRTLHLVELVLLALTAAMLVIVRTGNTYSMELQFSQNSGRLSILSYRPFLNLHFLIPISLRSSSILSIHLVRGFHLFLLPPGFPSKAFMGSLCSSILQTCPSHLNRKVLITVAKNISS
jgi:hypothetical protein